MSYMFGGSGFPKAVYMVSNAFMIIAIIVQLC